MGNLDSMLDELNNMENSITLRDENGEEVKLYVLEETKLNGESYLLASDTKDGDGEPGPYRRRDGGIRHYGTRPRHRA